MKKILFLLFVAHTVSTVSINAVSPSTVFAEKLHRQIVPLKNGDEAIGYLLELWTVFDLLRAIRLNRQEGAVIARELFAPLAVFDLVITLSGGRLYENRKMLAELFRDVQQVFDCAFEHIPEPEVFLLESLLDHVAESIDSLLSEAPTVLNNE